MVLKSIKDMVPVLNMISKHVDNHLNNDERLNLSFISNQMKKLCDDDVTFSIKVVKLKPSARTFIMCIYPDPDELEKAATPLMKSINEGKFDQFITVWSKGIKKWCIEIDSRLITKGNPICVDNGDQFVAILSHELGHIIDTHPTHLIYNYRMNRARIGMYQKMLSNKASVAVLFLPMFVCIDGLRVVVSKPTGQLKEISADSHIPIEYRPAFVSYIENHIMTNPTTASGIIVTEEEFDNEQKKGVMFTAECIRLMKQRRNIIKTQLEIQYNLSNNSYFKDVCRRVISGISGTNPDTGEVNMSKEAIVDRACANDDAEAVKEAAHALALLEMNVTMRDIMVVAADAQSIRSVEDKTYVINNIFDYMEALEKQRKKIISKMDSKNLQSKKSEATKDIDEKIKKLNDILTDVMNTKVDYYNNNHYGLFVKYPDGYEG